MSGKYWGNHFVDKLPKCNSEPICAWKCLFSHEQPKLIFPVYVDDSKLVGRTTRVKHGWKVPTDSGLVCFNKLKLPPYPSAQTLAAKLRLTFWAEGFHEGAVAT